MNTATPFKPTRCRRRRSASIRRLWIESLESRRVLAGNGPPNVLSITRLDSDPTTRSQVAWQVLFDEAVQSNTVDVTDFALTRGGSLVGGVVQSVSGTGDTYVVQASTGTGDGTLRLDLIDDNTIRDLSGDRLGGNGPGNGNFTNGQAYTVSRVPFITSVTPLDFTYTNASSVRFSVQFSENVFGVDGNDFSTMAFGLSGTSVTGVTGSGATYIVTLNTGTGDGSLFLNLGNPVTITNGSGQPIALTWPGGQGYSLDRTAPTVQSVTRLDSNPSGQPTVRFAVTFNEPVTDVGTTDFAPVATGLTGASIASIVSPDNRTWTVEVNTGSGNGTLSINLLSANRIADSAGNQMLAPGTGYVAYTIDKTPPTLLSVTRDNATTSNATSVSYTLLFSEPVTGLALANFTAVANGLTGTSVQSLNGSGASYTVTLNTGSGQGSVALGYNFSVIDAAGNVLNDTGTAGAYQIDRVVPTVVSILPDVPGPTASNSITFFVLFSESVNGVTVDDFQVQSIGAASGTVSEVTTQDFSTWTVRVSTGTGDGELRLRLVDNDSIVDNVTNPLGGAGAGNGDFTSSSGTLIEKPADIVSITPQGANPTSASSVTFAVVFSEAVTGVDAGDFALVAPGLTGSTISSITGSGSSYTVTVSNISGDGSLALVLNDNDTILDSVAQPLRGTGTALSIFTSSPLLVIDRVPPVVTSMIGLNTDVRRALAVTFTVTFSESVTGIGPADFALETTGTITGASVSTVEAIPSAVPINSAYTVTVIAGTGNGTLKLKLVDDDSIVDKVSLPLAGTGAGNGNTTSSNGFTLENSGESSIAGVVFQDLNRNGVRDAGEVALGNWTVYLDTNTNGVMDAGEPRTTSAVDGSYSFTGLFAGQYMVGEVVPALWEQTGPGPATYPVKRISMPINGTEPAAFSSAPSLSGDGRYTVFESNADLTNQGFFTSNVYLYDRLTGSITLISAGIGGAAPNGNSYAPSISNDGRMIAYMSGATNIVAGDTSFAFDILVFDRQTQTTTFVSQSAAGGVSNGASSNAKISGNGRFVAFDSTANNLVAGDTNGAPDVFVVDLQNSDPATRTQLVSKSSGGTLGNADSTTPTISDDGAIIAYQSFATNLVANDTNLVADIFVTDRVASTTRRISQTQAGVQGNGFSLTPAISGDGNFVAFPSNASNLSLNDSNATIDIYMVNLSTGAVEIVSRNSNGAVGGSGIPVVSTTGRYVAFESSAALFTGSGVKEMFVRDRTLPLNFTPRRVSQTQYGTFSDGHVNGIGMSDDAQFVAFASTAKSLVSGDINLRRDVFLSDLSYPWRPNTYTVSLGVSQSLSNLHFGNRVLQGEATGISWQDTSRNGLREANEPVNVGRQIYVDANSNLVWDPGESITTTDSTGAYRLTPIPTGTQRIREILPANWVATSPAAATYIKTLGTRSLVLNFEELAPVTAIFDLGVYEREGFRLSITESVANQWRVEVPTGSNTVELTTAWTPEKQLLMRKDFKAFDVTSLSMRSSTSTTVTFVGELQNGTTVTQQASVNTAKGTVTLNGFTNLRSLRWSASAALYFDNIAIQTTENDYPDLNFGSMTAPGRILGSAYYDDDRDGIRDANERPLVGRQIYLDADNDGIMDAGEQKTLSDASGNYAFNTLNEGNYVVRQHLPLNWTQSDPASSFSFSLAPNQTVSNLTFGSWGNSGTIQGTKWNDLNSNGLRDVAEPGLAGWTIYLDLNNNGALDAGEPSAVTVSDDPGTASVDETGNYQFTNLAPNTYTVREVAQAGWQQTSPVAMQSLVQFSAASGITAPAFAHHPQFDHFVSGNGRYEVFTSTISLLPQDTNSLTDVYLLDRDTSALELISVSLTGGAGNGTSLEPSISDDGRYVAFRSFATTLTATAVNSNIINIYVRDRVAKSTQLISNGVSSPANDYSYEPIISGDGRTLMFFSVASNLVANDGDTFPDLFIKDLIGGQLSLVNAAQVVPTMPIAETYGGDLSIDGRYVTFQAFSSGLGQIFWMDRATNQIRLVSTNAAGTPGNGQSEKRNISGDGRFVVFDSASDNLTDDYGVVDFNVYIKDMVTGDIRLISRNFNGGAAGGSRRPDISSDGRWVVFESTSQTMFADSTGGASQIVLYDRLTDSLTRLTDSSGTKGNAASVNASISSDGRTIAFQSIATNLGATGTGLFTIERTADTNTPRTITVPLAAGSVAGRIDLGSAQTNANITGTVFEDTNRNGLRDPGEAGILGTTMYLDINDNQVRDAGEPNTLTGSDGSYSFSNLLPSTYIVRAEVPGSRVATGPSSSRSRLFGVSSASSLIISELDPATGVAIGRIDPTLNASTAVGAAFDGTNVLLIYASSIVRVTPSGSTTRTTLNFIPRSGLAFYNGLAYYLSSVNSWPHLISFNPSSGQVQSIPITHSLDGYGPATFPTLDEVSEAPDGNGLVVTAAGFAAPDDRLLRLDPTTGRITQYITPANTVGAKLGSTALAGELFLSTTTGIHVLNNQFDRLRVMPTPTTYNALASGIVSDFGQTITVGAGQSVGTVNFGQRSINSTIAGRLWEDRNNNQQIDAGEPSLPGISVYIDTNTNFRFDAGEPTTQTDSNGRYSFANVASGSRTVRVIPPAGTDVSLPNRETRLFVMRVTNGVGALLELDPITGAIKNQLNSTVGTNISTSSGLAYDGTDLFLVDTNALRLYALNPATGDIRRSMTLANSVYDGLATVGDKLYVQNASNNTILEIDKQLTTVLRTLNLSQLNPNYFGPTAGIDLSGGLGETADGTRLIAQTANNLTSIIINPQTGIIEGNYTVQAFVGLTGAGDEVFTGLATNNLLDVYNSQAELVRRGSIGSPMAAGLAAASLRSRGARVVVFRGQDVALDIPLRDELLPSAITFSSTSIAENLPAGSVVGNLSTTDATVNDTHVYSLVTGTGDNDNALFEVVGNQLRTKQALDYESRSNYSIRLRTTDANGNSFETTQVLTAINLPEVASVQIGPGTAQRSTVDRLVIDFDSVVDIDSGAFLVHKRERDVQGALVLLSVDTISSVSTQNNGNTRVTLTFQGAYIRFPVTAPQLGALVDGNYQLTIDATKVRASGTPNQLDGDRNGTNGGDYVLGAQAADSFFALFGDSNGDRAVGIVDFNQFRNAFGKLRGDPGYDPAFDYESDGAVGITDFGQFRTRFAKILDF